MPGSKNGHAGGEWISANINESGRLSVIPFPGNFSPEEIIAEGGVGQDERQCDDGADEQKRLGGGRGRRLAESDGKWDQVGPEADANSS